MTNNTNSLTGKLKVNETRFAKRLKVMNQAISLLKTVLKRDKNLIKE